MEDLLKQEIKIGDFVTMFRSHYTTADTAFGIVYGLDNKVFTLSGLINENQVMKLPEDSLNTPCYKEAHDKLLQAYSEYSQKRFEEFEMYYNFKPFKFFKNNSARGQWHLFLGKGTITIESMLDNKPILDVYTGLISMKATPLLKEGLFYDKEGNQIEYVDTVTEEDLKKVVKMDTDGLIKAFLRNRYERAHKNEIRNKTRKIKISAVKPSVFQVSEMLDSSSIQLTTSLDKIDGEYTDENGFTIKISTELEDLTDCGLCELREEIQNR